MHPLIQLKTTPPLLITLTLLCFGFLPKVQATPDPGSVDPFNTADGDHALFSNTTGVTNAAFGWYALFANTDGSNNTAVGAGALDLNTGNDNTAVGTAALLLNTGSDNTAVGVAALETNSTGDHNTANGAFALFSNATGFENTAAGYQALFFNNSVGGSTGSRNSAFGSYALLSNSSGSINSAFGSSALASNTTGSFNTAAGYQAMFSNTTGYSNTADGYQVLFNNTVGSSNVAYGASALLSNTAGNQNIAIGVGALAQNTTGSANIVLGINAGWGIMTADNVICIGPAILGANVSDSCFIANIFGATSSGATVLVNSAGQLGTVTSSRRFKDDIKPMDNASEALMALKPVTFRYKKEIDPAGTSRFGLVAEDVEKVNPDLIVRDKEGKAYSVRYEAVNAMLLNEFLKEHRKIEQQEVIITQLKNELQATAAHQQKQIEALTAGLQKVSAQIRLSKPAPQTVNNP